MSRLSLALAALIACCTAAAAVEPAEQLANPELEARARAISSGLRCLVCQNETIDESNATLAHDLRAFLRERLTAGDSDEKAVAAIVKRYGDFVLLRPPVRPATWPLWFGPLAILGLGGLGTTIWLRRRPAGVVPPAPLTDLEQERIESLMREAER